MDINFQFFAPVDSVAKVQFGYADYAIVGRYPLYGTLYSYFKTYTKYRQNGKKRLSIPKLA